MQKNAQYTLFFHFFPPIAGIDGKNGMYKPRFISSFYRFGQHVVGRTVATDEHLTVDKYFLGFRRGLYGTID